MDVQQSQNNLTLIQKQHNTTQIQQENKLFQNLTYKIPYPSNIDNFRSVKQEKQFITALANQKLFKNLDKLFEIRRSHSNLQAKCKKCDAFIKYHFISSLHLFALIRFDNIHTHDLSPYVINQNFKNSIQKDIILMRTAMEKDQLKKQLMEKYDISQQVFLTIFNSVQTLINQSNSFTKLFTSICQQNLFVQDYYENLQKSHQQQASNLKYFTIINDTWKQNYKKYGQFMYIYSFQLNNYNELMEIEKWKLVVLSGLDYDCCFTPFTAICFSQKNRKKKLKESLLKFFKQMGIIPQTIVNNVQIDSLSFTSIKQLIQEQKYQIRNMKDYHILVQDIQKQTLVREIKKMINSFTYQAYNKVVNHLLEVDIQLYSQVEIERLQCIANNPQEFTPSSIKNSKSFCPLPLTPIQDQLYGIFQKIGKKCIKQRDGFKNIIVNILKQLNPKLNKKKIQLQKLKYENYFRYSPLKGIRNSITQKAFKYLSNELSFLTKLSLHNQQGRGYIQTKRQQQSSYIVSINQKGVWQCSCNLNYKLGMPCRHMLRYFIFKDINNAVIHNRWIFDSELLGQKINDDEMENQLEAVQIQDDTQQEEQNQQQSGQNNMELQQS